MSLYDLIGHIFFFLIPIMSVKKKVSWFLFFDNQGGLIWNTDIIKIQKYLPLQTEKKNN